ncbi:hypothetical protein NFX46_13825 [Streptomyces phaeoluteigriseus]|uniref:Secreted protein n=1 Tax=Streptomyces phaeoluteigriseus TaxID=114686 RepID=A0ABY4Z730_9ACTN|nr:hypothetical protein [Streptomyces phaeoluteigriseus]USQ84775.1 hypothetical protein NFX46_13825 [Streptomyces phaeoluteigriseus]
MRGRLLAVLFLAAALSGCSLPGRGTACTEMGMDSGVGVLWTPADFGGADAAVVRVCAGERCAQRASGGPDDPFASLSVRLPDDVGDTTVPVRLTVTSAKDGRVVLSDRVSARLTEQHPNGPSCPPTAWTASYRAHPERGLVPAAGTSPR